MAITNGSRQAIGFDSPSSSMLVTHVKQGDGNKKLDQEAFAQLLEESLGCNEHGQPNLTKNLSENYKLVLVVTLWGLDPLFVGDQGDPFKPNNASGRSILQLKQCLSALNLAIEQTTGLLFQPSGRADAINQDIPLYASLFPKLLSVAGKLGNIDISTAIFGILSTATNLVNSSDRQSRQCLLDFLKSCLIGFVHAASRAKQASIGDEIPFEVEDFYAPLNGLGNIGLNPDIFPHTFNLTQLLMIADQLSTFLIRNNLSREGLKQVKKHSIKLQLLVESSHDQAKSPDINEQEYQTEISFPGSVPDLDWNDDLRSRKRQRLSTEKDDSTGEPSLREKIVLQLTLRVTGQSVRDFDGFDTTLPTAFKAMSENDQDLVLERLGDAGCQLYCNTLDRVQSCPLCDETQLSSDDPQLSRAVDAMIKAILAMKTTIQRRKKLRLLALAALARLAAHTDSSQYLRLKSSAYGDWWLQSMRSSSRDLKILGSRAIRCFVRSSPGRDTTMVHENRVVALEYFQALWAEADPSSQESVVLALSNMAQVIDDEELNIILLKLVDYLGHRNAYISGVVYSELQSLAQHLQLTLATLVRPFWRTLAVVVVKNFAKRPEIAQQLSDLLGVQVDGLLQIIELHALPYLVLDQDHKLIGRMCASSGSSVTPFDICTKSSNLPRILAFLLSQAFPDPEQTIMALLLKVSEDFREQDLAGWIGLDPVQVACELLEYIGDAAQGKASKTYQGLQLLAQLSSRRAGAGTNSKRSDFTAIFLEVNALAIVTRLSSKLNEGPGSGHNVEKRRCLFALGEIVKLGKSRVRVALPQISACLRAAMEDKALCNAAFLAWNSMMLSLGEDEIHNLISQTFAIIVRSWQLFDGKTQIVAYNLVAALLKQYQQLIRDSFESLPSLASVPVMSKFDSEIKTLKQQQDDRNQIKAFVARLRDENMAVVQQAMLELVSLLRDKHDFLHKSILQEQPEPLIEEIERAVLDACVKFHSNEHLVLYAAQCLGAIGCLDPSKLENIREQRRFVLTSNFSKAEETTAFLMFFMEEVLVQEYVSSSNLREKGFLAWALQQLLTYCDLPADIAARSRDTGLSPKDKHWFNLSETTRLVLTPFLTSRFSSGSKKHKVNIKYPFFKPGMSFKYWLTEITIDFLNRSTGETVDLIFDICCRLVSYGQGVVIPSFLFPYTVLYLVLSGTEEDKKDIVTEISNILEQDLNGLDIEKQDQIRQCSQSIFDVLDYMSLWLQEVKKQVGQARLRSERGIHDSMLEHGQNQIAFVTPVLSLIPPKVITQRAIECRSYARALFHQEQYINSLDDVTDADYQRLQDIYAQIDEPDGIEGISAQIKFLDVQSEVMEHKKAGRWNTAQSWYEMQLMEHPNDFEIQTNLMRCLKESGQHDVLLHHFDGFGGISNPLNQNLLPFAIEAAWVTSRWDKLSEYLNQARRGGFAVELGKIMLAIKNGDRSTANDQIDTMFESATTDLTINTTSSFQASHESLLKMHVLDDVRVMTESDLHDGASALQIVNKRLDILGSYVGDKQYLLGIQRAIMQLRPDVFKVDDVAASWLTSARLARKAQATIQAFNSVLRASSLGDKSAAIEQAKLMWQEGHHRKAIQTLEGAIDSGAFGPRRSRIDAEPVTLDGGPGEKNLMTARAYVLLGKWLDQAGQTQSDTIIRTFRKSTEQNKRWEKGWYNLGRHYNKILESEKLKAPGKESQQFLTGETAKLVIDNFLRALATGNKYLFQTLPKVLTLWLELVGSNNQEHDSRRGNAQFHQHNANQRRKVIEDTNNTVKKYLDRIPVYALYTILPQLVARICHADHTVNSILQMMIVKVVRSFPQQALWTVLATVKSSSKDRATRGLNLIRKTVENAKKDLKVFSLAEMREFITAGQKFSDELLRIADYEIQGRVAQIRLSKDLGFNHKIAPSKLVVPCEACLIPNIPSNNEISSTKGFRPFAKEPIIISAFLDEARVLPSLQKPRKLMIRGSDGKTYSVLAKPHDDLRKDQRLMEFDTMINRFLKRDINASKRRLYIRTYAVVPLNEECGLIEWVDGLKTMRDILLDLYRQRGVAADYAAIREQLDAICGRSENKAKDFFDKVQSRFPPMLQQWFVESFPDATNWFNARLRYTRTSAVMSMVGHALGLGDRHGENILFEQGNGGILHVDFNCLFDKGLTFDKPEMVPFRLTHNMIDAFGPYKVDGPFRRSCEITLSLLRSNEDALMTILETFLHDPTTDFMTAGKKRKAMAAYVAGEVPDTPERMLEGVKGKVRGMLAGESVPLSVGGYVEEMIRRASDGENLARMYIGWCAFF